MLGSPLMQLVVCRCGEVCYRSDRRGFFRELLTAALGRIYQVSPAKAGIHVRLAFRSPA